jgi:hypothetical protein
MAPSNGKGLVHVMSMDVMMEANDLYHHELVMEMAENDGPLSRGFI